MAREPEFVFEFMKQVEALANDVLSDRRDIIELNKKRDKIREASRGIKKLDPKEKDPVWFCAGNLFLNLERREASSILDKDYDHVDKEISKLHKGLKDKVNKLYDAENKPELKGYDLLPMSSEEKKSLFDLIGK